MSGGMRRLRHSILFLMDRTCRGVAGSAAFARLLDLVSREEPGAPGNGDGCARVSFPELEYRAAIPAADPVPMAAPRQIRAWQVQWKAGTPSVADGLGYHGVGGFYLPRADGNASHPGILVLPVLHDPLHLASGGLARYLASQGFAALELRSGPSFLDYVRVTEEGRGATWEEVETEMIRDGRRGLDWLCGQREVDGRRLGIMGVSHGAIIGPCVMGADPRLQAGVFCMGGADQAMIVARSREPSVRRFRKRIMQVHGLTDPEELLRLPQAHWARTERMRYAAAVDPCAVLLFKTRWDRAVVPEAQDKLWEALGRPRRITLPLGHIGFGLAFYYAARRAAGFFRVRFASVA
jgi:dienelactone hydrolase